MGFNLRCPSGRHFDIWFNDHWESNVKAAYGQEAGEEEMVRRNWGGPKSLYKRRKELGLTMRHARGDDPPRIVASQLDLFRDSEQ